jgi:hypothetical protein
MYQGLDYDLDAVMQAAADSGLYAWLCTITQPPAVFGPSGAPDPTAAYVPVAGMIDIAADVAPSSFGGGVQPTETKELVQILEKNILHVSLLGFFPTISQDWRALLSQPDGSGGFLPAVEYDIVGTENSSQQRQTRLSVQLVTI